MASAQQVITLAEYRSNFNPSTGQSGAAATYGVVATGITRGPGITYAAGSDFSSKSWTTGFFYDTNDYYQFTISPATGFQMSLNYLNFNFIRDLNGPARIEIRTSKDNFASTIFYDNSISTGNNSTGINLGSNFLNLTSSLTIRVYACRATNANGILKVSAYSGYTKVLLPSGALAGVYIQGTRSQLTPPTNDNCENAITLPVSATCNSTIGTNAGATPSLPVPAGSCNSSGYIDVWYKFIMPTVSNPMVTIRTTAGTLGDAVMEVHVGTTCANKTYLTCEDDNANGNNSLMPVINLSGGPGNTIWVRIWGYGGAIGNFGICVLNYYSVNMVDGGNDLSIVSVEHPEETNYRSSILETDDNLKPFINVQPNPASDQALISYTQTTDFKVHSFLLSDQTGRVVLNKSCKQTQLDQLGDKVESLDISTLPSGVYYLQAITSKGSFSKKLIITR